MRDCCSYEWMMNIRVSDNSVAKFSVKQAFNCPGQFLIWVSSTILVRSHENSIWELLEKFLRILRDLYEILSLRKDLFFILTLMSFSKNFLPLILRYFSKRLLKSFRRVLLKFQGMTMNPCWARCLIKVKFGGIIIKVLYSFINFS